VERSRFRANSTLPAPEGQGGRILLGKDRTMIETPDIQRPPAEWVEALRLAGAATVSGTLSLLGIRNPHICGPVSWTPGRAIAGPALTLQFMPKREDLYGADEYAEPERQLHRHALYHTQPGDIVVVDARADMRSGVFGEMMLTYFHGRGGAGVVIDGCIRDYPNAKGLGLGLWIRGLTPNFHTQTDLMPFAVNGPVRLRGVLVMPGDIIVADDDGAVVVPVGMAEKVIASAHQHHEWEDSPASGCHREATSGATTRFPTKRARNTRTGRRAEVERASRSPMTPTPGSGNTSLPAMTVAEKASDMIREGPSHEGDPTMPNACSTPCICSTFTRLPRWSSAGRGTHPRPRAFE
jgi:regulator of RNase E activity RraA